MKKIVTLSLPEAEGLQALVSAKAAYQQRIDNVVAFIGGQHGLSVGSYKLGQDAEGKPAIEFEVPDPPKKKRA